MKHFYFLYPLLMWAIILSTLNIEGATRIHIENIRIAQNDLSARINSVKDLNGTNCALIKIYIAMPGVGFQGNIVIIDEKAPGEYYVYMTEGSKELRITVPGFIPEEISFLNSEVGAPLSSNIVYEIHGFIAEISSIMSVSSFNQAMIQRETLIKNGEYGEAINSLTVLRDSIMDIGVSQYIPLVESRINECKRHQTLAKTGFKEYGALSEGILMIRNEIPYDNGRYRQLIGFMDSIGNIVVEPKYDRAFDFNKGVAWVKKDGRWGCIDKKGAIKTPMEYKQVKPIKNNHEVNWMKVSIDSINYGVVDYATGRQVLPMKYANTSINDSPEDNPIFALYNPSQKTTYFFNKEDCSLAFSRKNQIIDAYLDYGLFITFKKTGTRKNMYGKKIDDGDRGIVDNQGRQVLECQYIITPIKDLEKAFRDTEDFVMVKYSKTKDWDDWQVPAYRIYSLKEREYIETDEDPNLYTEIVGKWKDWIVVGRWHEYHSYTYYGMVNIKNGTKIFDPYADIDCRPYNRAPESVNEGENLILECTGRKWYLFNNEGELIELPKNESDFNYRSFRQGHAILKNDGKYGFVDSNGNIIVNPIHDDAFYDFKSDSWHVKNGDKTISLENLITTSH